MERGDNWCGDGAVFRRRDLMGPIALFGRGRMLSFVLMAAIALFSYLTNQTTLRRPTAGAPLARAGLGSTGVGFSSPAYANEVSASPGAQELAGRHGGFVEDARTAQLRQVGARLTSYLTNLSPGELRFYLLRDSEYPMAYTLGNGSILMTVAMFDRMQSEDEVAAVVSQRITDFVYHGYDRSLQSESQQFAVQLHAAAGYAWPVAESARDAARIAAGSRIGSGLTR